MSTRRRRLRQVRERLRYCLAYLRPEVPEEAQIIADIAAIIQRAADLGARSVSDPAAETKP